MDTDLGRQIGENLKRLRRERGLTLGQLAALAGLSKAMLSDIEKGGANPTVNTVWKLANGLKVPYTRLLEGETPAATLVRGADLQPQTEGDGHYRVYCCFPGDGQRNFELFYLELDPRCANTSAGHLAQPQEYVCLLQGQLVVETGGQTYTLDPGDALAFDSTQAHTYRNPGDTLVRGIILNYFPG